MADDEGPISTDYSQRKADLAKCLDGLLLSDPFETWSYQGPFYVLPVEVHEETLVGYFLGMKEILNLLWDLKLLPVL